MSIRQRIVLYLVLGALAGLACAGVDYETNVNSMSCSVAAKNQAECDAVANTLVCRAGGVFDGGRCQLAGCVKACDAPATPLTNCPFGKTNGGATWTVAACKSLAVQAGCSNGTVYSFGCFGYHCTNLKCGH